ncbi:MAG TPA: MFS transporter [Syntrophorhabdaceae bacterium]|nr:MFS transporter [Syntrophorhabdaceae bacterium]
MCGEDFGLRVILKQEMRKEAKSLLAFPVLAALFTLSMFYRVTNAVMAPDLTREFNLDPQGLGLLGSAFFYVFAVLQIPMGILLDRVGPRRVICFFSLVGAAGALLFACAGSFSVALAGRALIGAGMASALMGALKVFATGYSPQRFSTLSGSLMSIGTLGNFLATTPLVYVNSLIGWRVTFVVCALITAMLALVSLFVINDTNASTEEHGRQAPSAQRPTSVLKTSHQVLASLSFWQIGAIAFFRYGTFVALQGIWFGPYLMFIKGFNAITTGNILMMLAFGMIMGSPVAGYLADRVFRATKPVALAGIGCYALCLVPLTGIMRIQSPVAYSVLFLLIGFASGFGMLAYSHIKELFPLTMSGTVIAGINFFVMVGGALFMQIIGVIISLASGARKDYPPEAYHLAFLVCFVGMTASLIFYGFSKQKYNRPETKLQSDEL